MFALDLVNLTKLMALTSGRTETTIGLIDGPVDITHPLLADANIRKVAGGLRATCRHPNSMACLHGTFVAGILFSRRNSSAAGICPNCTLLVQPIFAEAFSENIEMPSATPEQLAAAIVKCVDEGVRVINLSVTLAQHVSNDERGLEEALDYAARRDVIVVAAAGNQQAIGGSAIIRHHSVIPVVACDKSGRPIQYSNLGNSIGKRGLRAPGKDIISLGVGDTLASYSGTSAAAPFVTGVIALLLSEFPGSPASKVKFAITQAYAHKRTTIVPPLLDAWRAYEFMLTG